MAYNPNDPRLPVNPASQQLEGLFGMVAQSHGALDAVRLSAPPERVRPTLDERLEAMHVRNYEVAEPDIALSGLNAFVGYVARKVAERAADTAEEAHRRKGVVRYAGESLTQPKHPDQKRKGWPGYSKRMIGKEGSATDPLRPNIYRPTTRSEKRATHKLAVLEQTTRSARLNSRIVKDQFRVAAHEPASAIRRNSDRQSLSKRERKDAGHAANKAKYQDDLLASTTRKFEDITASRDRSGRASRARGARARSRLQNMNGVLRDLGDKERRKQAERSARRTR